MKTIVFLSLLLLLISCDLSNGVNNRNYIISQSLIKGENIEDIQQDDNAKTP